MNGIIRIGRQRREVAGVYDKERQSVTGGIILAGHGEGVEFAEFPVVDHAVGIADHGGHGECAEVEARSTGAECGGGVRLAPQPGVGGVVELGLNSGFLADEAVFPTSIRSLPEPSHGGDVGFQVVKGDAPMGISSPSSNATLIRRSFSER